LLQLALCLVLPRGQGFPAMFYKNCASFNSGGRGPILATPAPSPRRASSCGERPRRRLGCGRRNRL